jgi:dihydroorotase
MSCAPARIFKLRGGTLRRGAVADVTVFDADVAWKVDPLLFRSKGRNTPYTGVELRGRVDCTVVDGRIVYRRTS